MNRKEFQNSCLPFLLLVFMVCIATTAWTALPGRTASVGESPNGDAAAKSVRAKNIILMVADGMGLADVAAARIHKNGLNGPLLHLELDRVGYMRTYSENCVITDSAAAASAWACGEKFSNGEVCKHTDGRGNKPSILEIAKKKGRSTGLVATKTITDATPAAFGAHVAKRECENEIARQYVMSTEVDVLLGGGWSKFESSLPDSCGATGSSLPEARKKGYQVVSTKQEMEAAVERGAGRLLGLFADKALTPEKDRTEKTTEPRLPDMARAALKILEKDQDGFFLMVEGSQIDTANHRNDARYQLTEILAFDEAVKTVLDWVGQDGARGAQTLLMVAADHETGGFAVKGPKGSLIKAGETVESGWTSDQHTGTDVVIWSRGPGSDLLARPGIENSAIYDVMDAVLQ